MPAVIASAPASSAGCLTGDERLGPVPGRPRRAGPRRRPPPCGPGPPPRSQSLAAGADHPAVVLSPRYLADGPNGPSARDQRPWPAASVRRVTGGSARGARMGRGMKMRDQPGQDRTVVPRRRPVRMAEGRPEGGWTDESEIVCCDCGDDPGLDYRKIASRLQRTADPTRWRRASRRTSGTPGGIPVRRHSGERAHPRTRTRDRKMARSGDESDRMQQTLTPAGNGPARRPQASAHDNHAALRLIGLAVLGHMLRSRRSYERMALAAIVLAAMSRLSRENRARTLARLAAWNKRQVRLLERQAEREAGRIARHAEREAERLARGGLRLRRLKPGS